MKPRLVPVVLCLAALSSAPHAQAQQPSHPQVRTALGNQDWDGAIALLEQALAVDEGDAQAWVLMGAAFEGRGDLGEALGMFEVASEFDAVRPNAHFHAARLCAKQGMDDEAIAHVEQAVEAGFVGTYLLLHHADLVRLAADERYKALVPPMPDSSECFVEKPRVIHTFYGEAPGDVFGWIGRDLGDADGDGKSDLLISAPYSSAGGPSSGKVYAYSGATGALLFQHAGKAGQVLGIGIECAGDVNGDGRMDAIAGAANLGVGPGTTFVYSGKDGSVLHEFTRGEAFDAFGRKVSGGVDFDRDGFDDVLIGAPGGGPDGKGAGRAFVYSGKTGEVLATIEGEAEGDAFGAGNAVWSNGEIDLLAIGAGNAGDGDRGRAYVYRWTDGAPALAFTIDNDETGSALGGMFMAFPGDMNGDGISEVYASDWQNNANGGQAGRIYVHCGRTGERLFEMTGPSAGEGFGTCTADVGDVTGDGVADLLVGSWQEASAAPSGGKCYLYSGADRTLLATYTCNVPGETLGFDTTGVGDLDGDGATDFLVTGGYSNVAGARSGRAFVIAGPKFE